MCAFLRPSQAAAFSLLTGVGAEAWQDAAQSVATEFGVTMHVHLIGPRRAIQEHTGGSSRASEIRDSGCVLVRPDHHVAWRADEIVKDPTAELRRVSKTILQAGPAQEDKGAA